MLFRRNELLIYRRLPRRTVISTLRFALFVACSGVQLALHFYIGHYFHRWAILMTAPDLPSLLDSPRLAEVLV